MDRVHFEKPSNLSVMRSLRLFILVPLSLLCSPRVLRASAQGPQGSILTAEVDAFINQLLADWTSPGGAAVAVVKLNEQGQWNVETKGYGIATANGTKVTENTRFGIGSNSKLFNILATGLLVNNETLSPRLSWTTKIASIIPFWGLEDPIATKQATIIDVMSHRTGMPRHDFHYKWSDDVPTIIKKMKFLKPSAEFRDVWQYDNSMYTTLSYLPTLVLPSKMPFARYVKEHIFDPLGMSSTTYSYDVANASGQLANGWTKQGNFSGNFFANGTVRALPFWAQDGGEDGNGLSGAGGVISTATDIAIWLQTLLLDGVKPGTNTSVIPVSAIERVATGISVVYGQAQFPELSPAVYGGGQGRGTYRGHELIEHGGDVPGFHSQISRLPFDNLGVAVLTNDDRYGPFIMEIIKGRILDAAFGLEPVDWSGRYKALLSLPTTLPATPRPAKVTLPPVNFTAIAGKYNNDGYGSFELCLISPKNPAASRSCQALASNISTILPGVVNPNIPTFVGEWNSPWATHLRITHFNGNSFNVSAFNSYPTGNPAEPFWTQPDDGSDGGTYAELGADKGHIGLGLTGVWGAGEGIPSPQGKTPQERSEVWFDKV